MLPSSSVMSLRYVCPLSCCGSSNQCFQVVGRSKDTDAALADHRARVYHATLLKILESAAAAAGEHGFMFNNGTCNRLGQLVIAILSGDYEE